MKYYCINLDRRKDRWEKMEYQFNKIGLDVERYSAIDGNDIEPCVYMKNGEHGCLLSHINLLRGILEKGYEEVCIFEDDIIFCDDYKERLEYYNRNVPDDWGIKFLGCHFNSCKDPELVSKYIYRVKCNYGAFAYIIKRSMVEKILNLYDSGEIRKFDNYFNLLNDGTFYCFIPFFVKTAYTISDLSYSKEPFEYEVVNKHYKNKIEL